MRTITATEIRMKNNELDGRLEIYRENIEILLGGVQVTIMFQAYYLRLSDALSWAYGDL